MNNPNSNQSQRWSFSFFAGSDKKKNPRTSQQQAIVNSYPLALGKIGTKVWLVGYQGKEGINRLLGMGLNPGAEMEIISSQPSGSVLVAVQDSRIGMGAELARKILVSDRPLTKHNNELKAGTIFLRDLAEGAIGRVVGYNDEVLGRSYKGKLLSMGLTPNTVFKIIRVAPLGDPVEILVRGFHLSLRKQEADALVVEQV